MKSKHPFNDLYTPEGEALRARCATGECISVWEHYPRPQMRRDSFFNLNGYWDFYDGIGGAWEKILVPFPPESLLSGIHRAYRGERVLRYKKKFLLPEDFVRGRVLLHFGAVDQIASVSINGVALGAHEGGYECFYFDITEQLQACNELCVDVIDRSDSGVLPYGKQRVRRGGMWYTPFSGIWQTVWLESVPRQYVTDLRIEPHENGVTLSAILNDGLAQGSVRVTTPDGEQIFVLTDGKAEIIVENPRVWSPEDPYLYEYTLVCGEDTVQSYFAIRTVDVRMVSGIPRLCLNGKPYFFHGLLDQGYWSDGLCTPADAVCFEKDILAMKALGFNMLRKHIKVEPARFYYDCDRLGMVVFQDMVNGGPYSFIRDTALPTVGMKKRNDRRMHRNAAMREAFLRGMEATVRQLSHFPSICYWTVFNEGWGQFDSDAVQRRLRALDATRLIDTASGWFDSGAESDVESLHIYFKPVRVQPCKRPLVLSEFGGFSYAEDGHIFNPDRAYGYGRCKSREAFTERMLALYREEVLPAVKKGLCASVYTQVSDVEDEINGLLTYDRRVCKVCGTEFADISSALMQQITEI